MLGVPVHAVVAGQPRCRSFAERLQADEAVALGRVQGCESVESGLTQADQRWLASQAGRLLLQLRQQRSLPAVAQACSARVSWY